MLKKPQTKRKTRPGALRLVWIAAIGLFFLSFFITYPDHLLYSLAVACSALVSTLIAFRWLWSQQHSWDHELISIRPLFQGIAFVYIILGPLPALWGADMAVSNWESLGYYWILYLLSPLAFLGYEVGYHYGIGNSSGQSLEPNSEGMAAAARPIGMVAFILTVGLFIYFSNQYGLTGIGFDVKEISQTGGEFQKALTYLFPGFAILAIVAQVVDLTSRPKIFFKPLNLFIILSILCIVILMSSRTRGIHFAIAGIAAYQLARKVSLTRIIPVALVMAGLLYFGVTTVRQSASPESQDLRKPGVSLQQRLDIAKNAFLDTGTKERVERSASTDLGYRVNGIEWPAAIMDKHDQKNIPYMGGEYFFWSLGDAIPNVFIWFSKNNAEGMSAIHFRLTDVGDQLSTLFGCGIADFGPWGVFPIFLILGFFHAVLWRYVFLQKSSVTIKFVLFACLPELLNFEAGLGQTLGMSIRHGIIYYIFILLIIKFTVKSAPPAKHLKPRFILRNSFPPKGVMADRG